METLRVGFIQLGCYFRLLGREISTAEKNG
jgi:hypothetical protein